MAALVRHSQAQKWTLNLCIKLLWNFKNLTDFSTDWLSDTFRQAYFDSYVLRLWAWFLHCSMSLHPETCLFANCCSSNAHIMVLSKFTFVLLCSPFFPSLLCRWQFAVVPLHGFMEDLVTAVIAGVFNMLSFCLKTFCKMLDNTENEA